MLDTILESLSITKVVKDSMGQFIDLVVIVVMGAVFVGAS